MAEPDAVRADPKHYTVEMEDDRVRVLRTRYEAGDKSVPHSHPPHLAIFLTDAHIRFNDQGQNIAKGMGVIQIQNGRPVVVYPEAYKEADLVYPMPPR